MSTFRATAEATVTSATQRAARRRRRRAPDSRRLLGSLAAVAVGVSLLVGYVVACASATRHSYEQGRLRARLHQLQAERKHLEAQVAELKRIDRILYEAKRQGMQPRQELQYVALVPEPAKTRSFQHASARP